MQSAGLLLSEELFLLMLAGRTGKKYTRGYRLANAGVAGAMLDDLFLAGRLTWGEKGKVVADPTPTGDPLLDVLLATIADSGKTRSMFYWIRRLWNAPCVERVGGRLAARGIIARTERRVLGVFWKEEHFALVDGAARERIVARLRAVVFDGVAPDVGTRMLLGLLWACDCLRVASAPDERGMAEQYIEEIAGEDAAASAIRSYLAVGNMATG